MGKKRSVEESRRAGFIMGIVCPVRAAVKVHRACQPREREEAREREREKEQERENRNTVAEESNAAASPLRFRPYSTFWCAHMIS